MIKFINANLKLNHNQSLKKRFRKHEHSKSISKKGPNYDSILTAIKCSTQRWLDHISASLPSLQHSSQQGNLSKLMSLEKNSRDGSKNLRRSLFCIERDSRCSGVKRVVFNRLSAWTDNSPSIGVGLDAFNYDELIEVNLFYVSVKIWFFPLFFSRHFLLIGALNCFHIFLRVLLTIN
jgi:hypothetical protein